MQRLAYLAVLLGCLVGAGWLEWGLRTRVIVRWRRLLFTLLPVVAVFVLWDLYAIHAGHWSFDPQKITGIACGPLPLDEVLFFIVIPYCAILTLEAVRAVKGWPVGDELPDRPREDPVP